MTVVERALRPMTHGCAPLRLGAARIGTAPTGTARGSMRRTPCGPNCMRIGELSRLTGASAKAIRLYESIGLLPPVARRGAYREYMEAHRQQVLLIRRAQSLGISLARMRALRPRGDGIDWRSAALLLRERQDELNRQLQHLQQQTTGVAALLAELATCPDSGVNAADCLAA